MTEKLVDELYMTGDTTGATYYSPIVSMNGMNGAMIELWVTSASGTLHLTNGVKATLEGSNDRLNWDDAATTAVAATITSAPGYDKGTLTGSETIPYGQLAPYRV